MKRSILRLALAAGLLTAGWSFAQTNITFWHIFDSGDALEFINEVVADFNAANPDIHVEHLGTNFWDYWTRLTTAMAAGTGRHSGGEPGPVVPEVGAEVLDVDIGVGRVEVGDHLVDELQSVAGIEDVPEGDVGLGEAPACREQAGGERQAKDAAFHGASFWDYVRCPYGRSARVPIDTWVP